MSENRLRLAADLSSEQMAILDLLREQPFSSVADLVKRHEFQGKSRAGIHRHLQGLFTRDYVDRIEMGWTQKAKHRYFLISKGNTAVERISGKPTEWAETELALRRLSTQGQLLEMSYDIAPGLFSSGAVCTSWRCSFPLVRWRWVSRGPVSAVAQYGVTHSGNALTARLLVPFVWYGRRPKPNPLPKNGAQWLDASMAGLDDQTGSHILFGGVVILAPDRLAGMRARRDLDPSTPRAIVTADQRYGGPVIEAMMPESRKIRIGYVDKPPVRLGQPERIKSYLKDHPVHAIVQGKTSHLILTAVEEWPAGNVDQMARLCGHPPSTVRKVVRRFEQVGLVEGDEDGKLYPTAVIRAFAEDRDRLSHRKSRGRAGAERSPTGKRRAHMSEHEAGVVEIAARFKEAGIFAAAGWRMIVAFPYRTQIVPDLWALIPLNDTSAVWHAVEYEKTATEEGRIGDKLRPYRVAVGMGEGYPLLMVCETEKAAESFAALGRDLPMCVGVYHRVLKRPFYGPASAWSSHEAAVDVDHLRHVPLWSEAAHVRSRYILVERTDLRL